MTKSLKVIALGISLFINLNLSAQERPVTVTYKTNPDRIVNFNTPATTSEIIQLELSKQELKHLAKK